jgi:DNA-binding LytR/AlgR family response regulator
MNILIIEDEEQATRRLETLIGELVPLAKISGRADSVKSAVKWFKNNPQPDLIFMDVQLGDGLSFEIFEMTEVAAPIIFTTAYDAYALKAFKVNSIDYILKPVDKDDLKAALQKFNSRQSGADQQNLVHNISQVVQLLTKKYKERFVIKVGEHLRTVEVTDILYFYSSEKATFCATQDNRTHILDFTLDQVELMVNPDDFYRVNRKYIVRSAAIKDIISYTNSRLKLMLAGSDDNDIIVSRERVQEFRQWLDR